MLSMDNQPPNYSYNYCYGSNSNTRNSLFARKHIFQAGAKHNLFLPLYVYIITVYVMMFYCIMKLFINKWDGEMF